MHTYLFLGIHLLDLRGFCRYTGGWRGPFVRCIVEELPLYATEYLKSVRTHVLGWKGL